MGINVNSVPHHEVILTAIRGANQHERHLKLRNHTLQSVNRQPQLNVFKF